jgi:23S rRNA (cytidine1920-2'-O)/16S rRNA (cytidine1409-2'-O)-methyltransferase
MQQSAVERVRRAVEEFGGSGIEVIESPILGAEGNREFLLHARFA